MRTRLLPAAALLSALTLPALLAQDASQPQDWPRQFEDGGETFTVYQPQVETWDGVHLSLRAAVSVQAGSAEAVYGVVWLQGMTQVDKESRLVALTGRDLPRVSFPTGGGNALRWLGILRRQ